MRTLLLGGTGMLGRALVRHWRSRSIPCLALSHAQADIRDGAKLADHVDRFAPELIVNCAAFTQVDACEAEAELAMAINGEALAQVTAAAARCGARLVHISSDYVFDGTATAPIVEDTPTGPTSSYGRSKLRGEELALAYEKTLVIRASWLFGPGGPNFVATIRRLLLEGRGPLRVVDDQWGRPTYTPFLARAIAELAARGTVGLMHYGNREPTTWFQLARAIGQVVAPGAEILPVTTAEFPRPAKRPAYSVLDVGRFEAVTSRHVETWMSGLLAYLEAFPQDP